MENRTEYNLDYLKSDLVWKDIREDCNQLLEDVSPKLQWISTLLFITGSLGLIGPIGEVIKKSRNENYVAPWERFILRKLETRIGEGYENLILIYSYGRAHPSQAKVVEIHSGMVGDDFLRLRSYQPSLHRWGMGARGYSWIEDYPDPPDEIDAEVYKRIVDRVKQLQQARY